MLHRILETAPDFRIKAEKQRGTFIQARNIRGTARSSSFPDFKKQNPKAEAFDIELSSDFIVMASELMLIKSRMLLPRNEEEEEDPRAALAAAVLEYQRAKEASAMLGDLFSHYGLRMAKDTDEITVDKSFVADHDVSLLFKA